MKPYNIETIPKGGRIHFVGIGGISMSSLALLSLEAGYSVSGSDRSESALTKSLSEKGIEVTIGHFPENVHGAVALVYTAAVSSDSPELCEAERLGIPTVTRSDFLGGLMRDYKIRIGVSGTHGKTTTTSMLAHIFIKAELDPTVANGAVTKELGGALRIGSKEHFIYEACEYKESFRSFLPTVAVVTNIELDHTDYYSSLEEIKKAFAASVGRASLVVANFDDENVVDALKDTGKRLVGFSIKDRAVDYFADDIQYENGKGSFTLTVGGKAVTRVVLPVIGEFNICNALAAIAAADLAGVSPETSARALEDFEPAKRRFEIKYRDEKITVADDYAHHPSEIAATLSGASKSGAKRVIAIFQPHTYSRTKDLFFDFAKALSAADRVLLADIYAARETDTLGVSSALLAKEIENAIYCESFDKILTLLDRTVEEGDLVITMGAGDIYKVGEAFAKKLLEKKK